MPTPGGIFGDGRYRSRLRSEEMSKIPSPSSTSIGSEFMSSDTERPTVAFGRVFRVKDRITHSDHPS